MTEELPPGRAGAVELLELHDSLDLLDEELRVQKIAFRLTPLVSIALAAPLLVVLFLGQVRFFIAYPSAFVIILGAILYALTAERRRLKEKREAIRRRLREMEDVPARSLPEGRDERRKPCTS